MSAASTAAFLQVVFFKSLVNAIGVQVAFYFFGVICLCAAVFVIIYVPETKTRSLEEIYEDLKTKKEKRIEREKEMASSAEKCV